MRKHQPWRLGASLAAVWLAGCQFVVLPSQVNFLSGLDRHPQSPPPAGPGPKAQPQQGLGSTDAPAVSPTPTGSVTPAPTGSVTPAPGEFVTPSPVPSGAASHPPTPSPALADQTKPGIRAIYLGNSDTSNFGPVEVSNAAPGSLIDIGGERFGFPLRSFQVRVGGEVAVGAERLNDGLIRARVPSAARTGKVSVVVDGVESDGIDFQVIKFFQMDCPGSPMVVGGEWKFGPAVFDTEGNAIPVVYAGQIAVKWPNFDNQDGRISFAGRSYGASLRDGYFWPHAPGTVTIKLIAGHLAPQSCTREVLAAPSPNPSSTVDPYLAPKVTTYAGTGGVSGFADGFRTGARFANPAGIAYDRLNNRIVVADLGNHMIREIGSSGVVNTLAGTGTAGYQDGRFASARFNTPSGVAVDGAGNVYVSDMLNNRIRKITPSGDVTTLTAGLNKPGGLTLDASGNLYVADTFNQVIRRIAPDGIASIWAGSGLQGYADGSWDEASFNNPTDVKLDGEGNLWVADFANRRIRKIAPSGTVTTAAGSGIKGFSAGSALDVKLGGPVGLAVDAAGRVFFADEANNAVGLLSGGTVNWIAGGSKGSTDGQNFEASFNFPQFIAIDGSGDLLVTDYLNHTIRKLDFD